VEGSNPGLDLVLPHVVPHLQFLQVLPLLLLILEALLNSEACVILFPDVPVDGDLAESTVICLLQLLVLLVELLHLGLVIILYLVLVHL